MKTKSNPIRHRLLLVGIIYASLVTASLGFIGTFQAAQALEVNLQENSGIHFAQDTVSQDLTRDIFEELKARHYKKLAVDDTYSEALLNQYIKTLDASRIIFLASDIKEFDKYQTKLDDELLAGELEAGQAIYNRFQQRSSFLLQHTLKDVARYFKPYPNPGDASIEIDREHSQRPETIEQSISLWDKRIYNEALLLTLSVDHDSKLTLEETLKKRYEVRLKRLNEIKSEDAFSMYINSALALYDPHTDWQSPKLQENFKINMSLSLEGIGAVLQQEDEKTKITRLVTGGPAAKSGALKAGDFILAVGQGKDGELVDMVGLRLDEVVEKIRGPKGSVVRLQIEDGSNQNLKVIKIERDQIKLEDQAAKSDIIEQNGKRIGIINVPAFYLDFEAYRKGDENFRSTTRDVEHLLFGLKQQKIDGLVIDLRNNGGGSLQEAKMLTNLFINQGPIVQIRASNDQIDRSLRAERDPLYLGPLLLLTNHLSASASEIFAGAIQDYERGLIVGERTFGKGTVQTLDEMNYGQLKYTNAKFYRVSGDSTQHRGVLPDIELPSLFDFKLVGESSLDFALPWDQIHEISHVKYNETKPFIEQLTELHKNRVAKNPDYAFLLKRIARRDEQREIKTVSLNQEERIKQRNEDNQWLLNATNTLQKANGKAPFESFEALEKNEEEKAAKWNGTTVIDVKDDFVLKEGAAILANFIDLKLKTDGSSFAVIQKD